MINKRILLIIVLILLIIGIGYYFYYYEISNHGDEINEELFCETNEDCVSNTCCHADSCVNKQYRPSCSGMFCTQECISGTLDCGQASCGCINNQCEVRWR